MDRKCKGSLVLDMVKLIRAFRSEPWESYLKPEDWEIVNGMVIPTSWYPIESYQRIGLAVYQLVAKGNADVIVSFGRAAMDELFKGPYRPFLDKNDPFAATQKFLELRKPIFNFSKMQMLKTGDKSLSVRLSELGNFDLGLDLFLLLSGAHFVRLIELNGGQNVQLHTRQEGDHRDPVLVFDLAWS